MIAESELNRAQLLQDWRIMAGDARTLAHQARTISSLASAAASLVVGLVNFRRNKPDAREKTPWWQSVLKGAGLVTTFWQAIRPGRYST